MPRPTSSTTLQRPDLGAIAYEYALAASHRGFIADAIMPPFEVDEQSADYPVIPIEAFLKMPPSIQRQARGNYQRGDYEFGTGTYACKEYGWEEPLDEVERKLYRRFYDAEVIAVLRATDIVLRHREKRVADKVFNTGNITNTSAVSTPWSYLADCTPKADVQFGKVSLRDTTGIEPDAMAVSKTTFENLLNCAELKDYLKYTNPHLLANIEAQKNLLAQYLGLEEIQVGNAIFDSAKQGQAKSLAGIWSNAYALLYKKPTRAEDLREPVLGRTFLWTADSPEMLNTDTYREEQIRSDIYRVRHFLDEAFVFTGAAYLLSEIAG